MMPSFPTLAQPTPPDAIDAFAAELARRAAELPVHALLPGEALRLSGHLFAGAVPLVLAVGEALQAHPELFPSSPVTGQALLAAQERATAWLLLRDQLQLLTQRAQQAYLLEQGEAVRAAYCVLQQVDHEDALPPRPGGPDRVLREAVLAAARRAQASRPRRSGQRSRRTAGRAAARVELRRLLQGGAAAPGGGEPGPEAPGGIAAAASPPLPGEPSPAAGPAAAGPGWGPSAAPQRCPAEPPDTDPAWGAGPTGPASGHEEPPPPPLAPTRTAGDPRGRLGPAPRPGPAPGGLDPGGEPAPTARAGPDGGAALARAPCAGMQSAHPAGLPRAPAVPRSCKCACSPPG
ncbi:MAG: hypothetical protein NZ890_01965 [Myxococcota bacterium]|nr:hypothetical protein [Myxococcota bacterium]